MEFRLIKPDNSFVVLSLTFPVWYIFSGNIFIPHVIHSIMAVPATVIYFTCYDQLYSMLRVRMGDFAQEAPLLAGALARGELTQRSGHRGKRKNRIVSLLVHFR